MCQIRLSELDWSSPQSQIRNVRQYGPQIEDNQVLADLTLKASITPELTYPALRGTRITPRQHNEHLREVLEELGLRTRILDWCQQARNQEPEIDDMGKHWQGFSQRTLDFLIEILS